MKSLGLGPLVFHAWVDAAEMAAVVETSAHSTANLPEVGAMQHPLRRWLWYSLRGSPVMRAEYVIPHLQRLLIKTLKGSRSDMFQPG